MADKVTITVPGAYSVMDTGPFVLSYSRANGSGNLYNIASGVTLSTLLAGYVYEFAFEDTNGIHVRSVDDGGTNCIGITKPTQYFPVLRIENAFNNETVIISDIKIGGSLFVPAEVIVGDDYTRYYHLDTSYESGTYNMYVDITSSVECDLVVTDCTGTTDRRTVPAGTPPTNRQSFTNLFFQGQSELFFIIRVETHV